MSRTLQSLRKKIDRVDSRLLELLNHRARLVMEVGKIKEGRKASPYVPFRERTIVERLSRKNRGPFPNHALQMVYQEIFSASRSLQSPLKVVFLGPVGTFSHMAALKQFGGSTELVPVPSIPKVFEEVEHHRAEYGMIPIENSTEGIVNISIDSLSESSLSVVGELSLPIAHHLMSLSGKVGSIKKIFSHPQATAQCRFWLEENLPGLPVVDAMSTASAAEQAAVDEQAAAIASEYAAQVYQLKIVRRHIEDQANNWTRFLVLSRTPAERTGKDKTSLIFALKDEPGILYKALEPFSRRGINLTTITSRPVKKKAWEYLFFIDVEGHVRDRILAEAIRQLQRKSATLKILGSYPKGT